MNHRVSLLERIGGAIVEFGFFSLAAVTPFLFGSVPAWASVGIEVVIAVIFIGYLVRNRYLPSRRRTGTDAGVSPDRLGIFPRLLLFGGFLFFLGAVLQLIPLPGGLIRLLSPSTVKFHLLSGRPAGSWLPLSVYPRETAEELARLLSYAAAAWVIINYRPVNKSKPVFLTGLILVVLSAGFIISLEGIMQKYGGGGKIYGVFTIHGGNSFGPYVNRNHFAGYIGMVIPLGLGMSLCLTGRRSSPSPRNLRGRIIGGDIRLILLGFINLVMIVALFLTLSRGGILAFLGSMVFFVLLARKLRLAGKRKILRLVAALLVLLLLALGYFGYQPIIKRFDAISSRSRAIIWKDTGDIFRSYPLLGTGLGTFRDVFRNLRGRYNKYQRRHPIFYKTYPFHAENDYLQLLAEAGCWGGGSLLVVIISYFGIILARKPVRGRAALPVRSGDRRFRLGGRCVILGCSTSVAAFLLHGLVDFNFHIPANALLFFILAGASLSAAMESSSTPGPAGGGNRRMEEFRDGEYNNRR